MENLRHTSGEPFVYTEFSKSHEIPAAPRVPQDEREEVIATFARLFRVLHFDVAAAREFASFLNSMRTVQLCREPARGN